MQEDDIRALGRRLLEAAGEREPLVLTPAWWQERLLDWATGDPEFRVTLLRFVDTLPALRSASAVADHVRQYFQHSGPGLVRAGSELGSAAPFRPVLSRVVREGVYALAHRFIAGESPEAAVAAPQGPCARRRRATRWTCWAKQRYLKTRPRCMRGATQS